MGQISSSPGDFFVLLFFIGPCIFSSVCKHLADTMVSPFSTLEIFSQAGR